MTPFDLLTSNIIIKTKNKTHAQLVFSLRSAMIIDKWKIRI